MTELVEATVVEEIVERPLSREQQLLDRESALLAREKKLVDRVISHGRDVQADLVRRQTESELAATAVSNTTPPKLTNDEEPAPSALDVQLAKSSFLPAASLANTQRIGEILSGADKLTEDQIQTVLQQQAAQGKQFGETAIALGMVNRNDIIMALSKQFNFHYSGTPAGASAHKELVMANAPFSDEVECFRNLRTDLHMGVLAPGNPDRTALALVSANIGDGKTFTLANLAVAFSQNRARTLIVDADMRSPRLHNVFGIENTAGLSHILSGRIETQVVQPVSYLPNLYMLPAGSIPPNPTELILQPAFEFLLQELVSKFDVVLVDTPAGSHGSDATVVAAKCGTALVVARQGQSRAGPLQDLVKRLRKSSVNLAGVMMNTV